jgi:Tfp pilus assembly protein PilF
MYVQALAGHEKVLEPDHTSTLAVAVNFGSLFCRQGRLDEAERMYQRALTGIDNALGSEHM